MLEVMKEVGRVLKPGGMVILSTSNRCFPTKAAPERFLTSVLAWFMQYCYCNC